MSLTAATTRTVHEYSIRRHGCEVGHCSDHDKLGQLLDDLRKRTDAVMHAKLVVLHRTATTTYTDWEVVR